MRVNLKPGERIFVAMDDAEDNDDGIMVEYDFQNSGRLTVSANYPDDRKRDGVIYSATLEPAEGEPETEGSNGKSKIVKTIVCSSCGNDFHLTQGEVEFMQGVFKDKYKEPLRCKKCRVLRMRRRGAFERQDE